MKRTAGLWLLLAGLTGCVSMETGPESGPPESHVQKPPTVPGVQGPWGQPVPMAAPYSSHPPRPNEARAMMSESLPLDMMQMGAPMMPGAPPEFQQALAGAGGMITPPGVPFAPAMPAMATQPNGEAGGSIMQAGFPGGPPPGAVPAVGALAGGGPSFFPTHRTEVRFVSPAGMKVSWFAPGADGKPGFTGTQIDVPGRYNFAQAAIYRLKLTNIPNRPDMELYPTLEVVPSNARTDPFLAHSSVPVSFTEEDFDQVAAGNYVVKVIYLPSPQFQDLATTGPDEVVSSRLEPGVDPIAEAHRRGNILLVIRMGNILLELPNTPSMDAPNPYAPKAAAPVGPPPGAGMMPPMAGGMMPPMAGGLLPPPGAQVPGPMVPYEALSSNRPLMLSPNMPPMVMTPQGLMVVGPPRGQVPPAGLPPASPGSGGLPPVNPGYAPAAPGARPSTGPAAMLPNLPDEQNAFATAGTATATDKPAAQDQANKKPVSLVSWLFGSKPEDK